ncbi:hypothetical protein ACOMHN_010485 [Nucella lapillus]
MDGNDCLSLPVAKGHAVVDGNDSLSLPVAKGRAVVDGNDCLSLPIAKGRAVVDGNDCLSLPVAKGHAAVDGNDCLSLPVAKGRAIMDGNDCLSLPVAKRRAVVNGRAVLSILVVRVVCSMQGRTIVRPVVLFSSLQHGCTVCVGGSLRYSALSGSLHISLGPRFSILRSAPNAHRYGLISLLLVCPAAWGSQTDDAYSKVGRLLPTHANAEPEQGQCQVAFLVMLSTRMLQGRGRLTVIPGSGIADGGK